MVTGNGFDAEFATPAEWARFYRSVTMQVVPAFMPGESKGSWKRPLLKAWTQYQDILVPDEIFEPWYGPAGQYRQRPNMGVITGKASGNLFVVDLDVHKKPEALRWWFNLMELHNARLELETVEQRTGGGGLQKLYHAPASWIAPTCKTAIGVDIRGQGGFAMLCPSMHESGHAYEWLEGRSPDETEITMAPDWLLEAIDALVREHGRATGGTAPPRGAPHQAEDFDGFGHQTDGREDKMHRMVFRCVVKWHRSCPIKPGDAESARKAAQDYEIYERRINPQQPHPADLTKTQKLDREDRGWEMWWSKWQGVMRKWDAKVRDEAAKPDPSPDEAHGYRDYTDEFAKASKSRADQGASKALPLILTGAEFLKSFIPPNYLIDNVMQRSGLYAMTARTGHGKTAVAMLTAFCVARGTPLHGKLTEQSSVLFFAGENSDDIRARYTVMLDAEQVNAADVPLYFIDGVISIQADMGRIQSEAAFIPNLGLVIIDTKQAYFLGDDGNSNEQQVWFAKLGRELIKLPGRPAVVFLCHPVKNAGKDSLVPLGGSAFLNEIDFNFTLWAEDRVCKLNPHPDKWRGPAFEEMAFELRQQNSAQLKDSKGREIPSVIAVPISEAGAERREAVAGEDEKQILRLMHADKNASFARLAGLAGWKQPNGEFAKSKVARVIARLLESKFVYRFHGSKYQLTKKGCKHIGVSYKDDDNE